MRSHQNFTAPPHSLPGWLSGPRAKWGWTIYLQSTLGAGVDTGQQVNLSIRRPFLEKIDSSAPSRSREGKVVAEAATALGEPPSNILDLEQQYKLF